MSCKRFLSLFCCSPCPGIRTSITPKILIIVFLYSAFLIEFLILFDILPIFYQLLPYCTKENEELCQNFHHVLIIYRVSLALYLYLAFMVIITHGIKNSRDDRALVHNACWFSKFVIGVALSLACLQIPLGIFDAVFAFFGAVHSVTFSVFEFVTFLRVSYKCTCRLLAKKGGVNYTPLVLVEGIMIGGPIIYLFFVYKETIETVEDTVLFVLTVFNVSFSYFLLFSHLIAVCVQRWKCMMLNGGLLCCQVVFFTTLAMFHFPNHEKLDSTDKNFFDIVNYFGIAVALISVVMFSIIDVYKPFVFSSYPVVYIEERGTEICKVWGKVKLVRAIMPSLPPPQKSAFSKIPASKVRENNRFVSSLKSLGATCFLCPFLNDVCRDETREFRPYYQYVFESVNENDDEWNRVKYKWRDFYIICNHLTMYMMMSLTKWIWPHYIDDKLEFEDRNAVAMWANFASCWCCCIAFVAFVFWPRYYQ